MTGARASRLLRARETPLANVAKSERNRNQSPAKSVCIAALANGKRDARAPVVTNFQQYIPPTHPSNSATAPNQFPLTKHNSSAYNVDESPDA